MEQNIEMLGNIEGSLEAMSAQETIDVVANAVGGVNGLDPQIFELLNQILALLQELSVLTF